MAAAPDPPEVQAQVLDHNQYLCSNCFFGSSEYYYCFKTPDKVLIAYQKAHTFNWKDPKRNDLAKVHKTWAEWVPPGSGTVPIRYDDKFVWVTRPNGKTLKLTQDYSTDIFVNNAQCRSAVHKKAE
jgi:hypothetical protein